MTHPIHPARAKKIGLSSLLEELAAKLLTPGQLLGVPLKTFGHNDSSELLLADDLTIDEQKLDKDEEFAVDEEKLDKDMEHVRKTFHFESSNVPLA